MPQEVIHPLYPGADWQARVGWARDGQEVQLAVESRGDRTLVETLFDSDSDKAKLGEALRASVSQFEDLTDQELGDMLIGLMDGVSPFVAVWATFDRAGANRLVRLVRGARDAAFGKDE